jgi:hypothetical protein
MAAMVECNLLSRREHPGDCHILFFFALLILCAAWFCALPVRAYRPIEQKINPSALLPVRAFISYLLIPHGEQEKSGIRVSIDMVPLTENS